MSVIAVDDETFALNDLKEVLSECMPNTEIIGFLNQKTHWIMPEKYNRYCFLDIEMNNMTGLQLAGQLTQINEKLILFLLQDIQNMHWMPFLCMPADIF